MIFLFKRVVLPLLVLLLIPVTLVALIYKPVEIPKDDYADSTNIDIESLLMAEFENLTLDASKDSSIKLKIDQKTLNSVIREALRDMNENYLNDDASEDERNFVIKEDLFAYQGTWVRFKKNNIIEIDSGVHIFIKDYAIKTRLLLAFKIEIQDEEIVLTLKKITVGNLPLAWLISGASWLAEKFIGQSIDDLIGGIVENIGTFDAVKREIRININSLLEKTIEDEGGVNILPTLIQFVTQNNLVDIGFDDNIFYVEAFIGKMFDDTKPFELIETEKIQSQEQLETMLLSKASSVILSTISKETPYIKLDDMTLNRVLEYFLRTGFDEFIKIEIFEGYEAVLKTPYIEIKDLAVINIPLIIKQTDLDDGFKTIIKINAVPEVIGNDLYFHLHSLEAGTLSIGEDSLGSFLSLIGDNEIIKNNAIVLENFDEMMQSSGINIKEVAIKNNNLFLYIQINMFEDRDMLEELALQALNIPDLPEELQDAIQNVLDNIDSEDISEVVNEMIGEMIETALEAVIDNPDIPEEVQEAIQDLLSILDEPESIDGVIEEIVDLITQLSDGDQETFFNDIIGSLEDYGMSYEDLLGLFS